MLFLRSIAPLLAALALLPAGGCADDPTPLAPVTGSCVVRGSVSNPLVGEVNASLYFRRMHGPHLEVRIETDPSGHYSAEFPTGDYFVEAYTGGWSCYALRDGGITGNYVEADTLRLEPGDSPREISFRLGAARLVGEGLEALDGCSVSATMYEWREGDAYGSWRGSEQATVRDGRLAVDLGPTVPGLYRIEVLIRGDNWQQRGERFWLPGVLSQADSDIHIITADSVATITADWPEPARLSGSIRGAWLDMGLEGPSLTAFNADSVSVAGPWRVNRDGSFDLTFLRPTPVRLAITEGNARLWVGGSSYDEATVFDLQPGATIDGIAEVVSGVLVRTTFAMPFPESSYGSLELRRPFDQSLVQRLGISLERQSGHSSILPGQYLVRVVNEFGTSEWRSQWYDRATTPATASLITVPAGGGTLVLDLSIERGGVFSGTVELEGSGRNWAYVEATSAETEDILGLRYVNGTQPAFALKGLEDGRYKLGLRVYDYDDEGVEPPIARHYWYPDAGDWAAAEVIEINGANTVNGLVLVLP